MPLAAGLVRSFNVDRLDKLPQRIGGKLVQILVFAYPLDSTGDLIEIVPDPAVFGGQLSKCGKQLVVDRGDRDNRTDTCALNGSADKLGLPDVLGTRFTPAIY